MHEGAPGSAYWIAQRELPEDVFYYGKACSFELYLSREKQEFIVGSSRYRPGYLYLPRSTIDGITHSLKNGEERNYHMLFAEEKEELPGAYDETLPGTQNWKIYHSRDDSRVILSCREHDGYPGTLHLTVQDLEQLVQNT